jgi:hypothetical protein
MYVQYTDEDIEQQVRIKDALDPSWLLNPGKVFPIEGRDANKMRTVDMQVLEPERAHEPEPELEGYDVP